MDKITIKIFLYSVNFEELGDTIGKIIQSFQNEKFAIKFENNYIYFDFFANNLQEIKKVYDRIIAIFETYYNYAIDVKITKECIETIKFAKNLKDSENCNN